jgi:hypothetical protein
MGGQGAEVPEHQFWGQEAAKELGRGSRRPGHYIRDVRQTWSMITSCYHRRVVVVSLWSALVLLGITHVNGQAQPGGRHTLHGF